MGFPHRTFPGVHVPPCSSRTFVFFGISHFFCASNITVPAFFFFSCGTFSRAAATHVGDDLVERHRAVLRPSVECSATVWGHTKKRKKKKKKKKSTCVDTTA